MKSLATLFLSKVSPMCVISSAHMSHWFPLRLAVLYLLAPEVFFSFF